MRITRARLQQGVSALLNHEDLAALLNVSLRQIYRMREQGRLPSPVHVSQKCVRWPRKQIEDWVAAGCPHEASELMTA
jgi:predicted DNA-binding transcriptional regulator AlpA